MQPKIIILKKITLIFINLFLSLTFILSLSVNAESEISTRIIGGTEAAKGDWPFMTAITHKGLDAYQGQFCGGSFIGSRYVLTAAHCVDGQSANNIDVSIGIHNLNNEDSEGERIAVQAIYMHNGYNPATASNDIAILELKNEVTTPKIELATETLVDSFTAGDQLTVMGWGNLSTTSHIYPNILNQVDVPYVDRSTCQNLGDSYSTVGNDAICAGLAAGGKDSCDGDSGGPLVYNDGGTYKQVGIVSWGNGCAQKNAYGVYTNVGYFNNNGWIQNKTSGVSYTQNTDATNASINLDTIDISLPIRNYSAEAFDVTNIVLPVGITMVNNTCTTTLNQNESCALLVQADLSVVANSTTVSVTTDHSVSDELNMKITFPALETPTTSETSSNSSGGASLGLGLLALFGLGLRRKKANT